MIPQSLTLLHKSLAPGLAHLFYRKSEIIPPENTQICQRIFDGLPFCSMTWQNGLNTIENSGFCGRYSLQEAFYGQAPTAQLGTHCHSG